MKIGWDKGHIIPTFSFNEIIRLTFAFINEEQKKLVKEREEEKEREWEWKERDKEKVKRKTNERWKKLTMFAKGSAMRFAFDTNRPMFVLLHKAAYVNFNQEKVVLLSAIEFVLQEF